MQKTKSKLEPADDFWDVKANEDRLLKHMESRISSAKSALRLAGRVSAIHSAPSFQSFVAAIEDLQSARTNELIHCDRGEDAMHRLQGGVRELGNIIALLKNAKASEEALAQNLKKLEDQRLTIVGADGKIRTGGI